MLLSNLPAGNATLLDDAAFEVLFREQFASLCTYCQYKFNLEPDAAKEAVHMGFLKLWESRASIDLDLSVKSYLSRIISNICLDAIRHEKVKKKHARFAAESLSDVTYDDHLDDYDLKKMKADIDSAVLDLPEGMRRIFQLSRFDGLKYAEIARQLNISVKTVETQRSRALIKLKEKLSRYLLLALLSFFLNS